MTAVAIGVDIGGTKIAVGAVDDNGTLIGDVLTTRTPAADGPDAILGEVLRLVQTVVLEHPDAGAVGVGSAGVFDRDGVVVGATDILPGWVGTRVSEWIASATSLPAVTINDVHAVAIAEHTVGAAAGAVGVLVVAVGTGIGGALIQNRALVPGRVGIAGSIGHSTTSISRQRRCSCGQLDHVEPHASGPGIELTYAETGSRSGTLRDIAALAAAGDAGAIDAIRSGGTTLGAAIASAVNLLDPDLVVVGGGVADIGGIYFDALRAEFSARALGAAAETPIVPAHLGSRAAVVGAGLLALRSI
jgi:glucokinase